MFCGLVVHDINLGFESLCGMFINIILVHFKDADALRFEIGVVRIEFDL